MSAASTSPAGAPPRRIEPPAEAVDTVPLPDSGTGARRSRRERRRRRRRNTGLVLAGVVAAVLVVVGRATCGWRSARTILDDDGDPDATSPREQPAPAAPAGAHRALLVQLGDDGGVVALTVLAVSEGGAGGDVVFLPAGTMVEVPSFGLNPLRDAHRDGGLPVLQASVENLLGISLDAVVAHEADGIASMLAPAGPLTVEVPDPVERVGPSGRVEVLFDEGPVVVAPEQAAELLAEPGGSGELDRLVRHEALWRAWVEAVGDDPVAAAPAGGLSEAVRALAAGEVRYHLLPVEALSSGLSAHDGLFRVRTDDLRALLGRILPEAAADGGSRIQVQVLNGSGIPGLAQQVQPALVRVGAAVALTGNADRFDYEVTQVVYYRDDRLDAARAVRDALGVGEVVKSLSGLDVVDVTVVVGQDFVAAEGANPGAVADDGESGGTATD